MPPALLRSLAWLALFGVASGFVLPLVDTDHAGRADPEARVGISAHLLEHAVPHFQRHRDAPSGEHCALCHWFRSLGQSTGTERVAVAPVDHAFPVRPARLGRASAGRLGCGAVRGPPVLS